MLRLQAFKYELRPDGQQERQMRRFAGARRFVFNKALALQKSLSDAGSKKLSYAALCRELTAWRNSVEMPWLSEAPSQALQQALKDLERAYTNFFEKRAGFPRFAKKGQSDSFRFPEPKQFKLDQANGRIFLPKLGWIRYRNSRTAAGTPKNVTVSRRGDKWFVSIQTEREVGDPTPRATSIVGVDRGINKFGALSDGTFIPALNAFAGAARKLARMQRQVGYKLAWAGGITLFVPPAYPSQKCSACGHVHPDNRKGDVFECLACGNTMDADTNASINIEAAGHAVLACGETAQSGRSKKQEPPEATRRSSRGAEGIPVLPALAAAAG